MLEKLRIKITIVATIIVTAYAYFSQKDFLKTCYTIILTIIIFYILGGFVEIFLKKQIDQIYHKKQNQEESIFNDQNNINQQSLEKNDNIDENNQQDLNKSLDDLHYIDQNIDYIQNEEQ